MNKSEEAGCGTDPKRRKRTLTEARKEQNRVAQRIYRQRQKERLQTWQRRRLASREKQHEIQPQPPQESAPADQNVSNRIGEVPEPQSTLRHSTTTLFGLNDTSLQTDSFQSSVDLYDTTETEVASNSRPGPYSTANTSFVSNTIGSSSVDNESSSISTFSQIPHDEPDAYSHPGSGNDVFGPDFLDASVSGLDPLSDLVSTKQTATSNSAAPEPPYGPCDNVLDAIVNQGLEHIISAGLDSILSGQVQVQVPVQAHAAAAFSPPLPLPNPYMNRLSTPETLTFVAYLHNARCLGIRIQDLLTHRCGSAFHRAPDKPSFTIYSPFYRPATTAADSPATLLSAAVSFRAIPPHLRPTLPQILLPHLTLLDLIPFPTLRARAITLAATNPPLFDPMDFKSDVMQGGIICCREQRGGSGQPWDVRSWEVKDWFRRKWRMLMDGSGVE